VQLTGSIDNAQSLAAAAHIERSSCERGDDPEVRAYEVAEVAVHVIQTVVAAETHLT
jgi:hypothetical protein